MTGFVPNWSVNGWLNTFLNVKNFGAKGDGLTDDSAAIQSAIDTAFGSAASPHGTSATNNRAIFFPGGTYIVNTPLTLTRVRGAYILGAGQNVAVIDGINHAVVTNGLDYSRIENISFNANAGSSNVAFELDWDGTGSVGLSGNVFHNCSFAGGDYAFRIALSGSSGFGNQFYACNFNLGTKAGLVVWSSLSVGHSIQGGGASQNATGFWIKAGQIASINDNGLSGNSSTDVMMDSVGPILIKGTRTESSGPVSMVFNSSLSVAVLDGFSAAASVSEVCHTKGKVIVDSLATDFANSSMVFCSSLFSSFNGTAYFRGCSFSQANFLTAFSSFGTIGQNI